MLCPSVVGNPVMKSVDKESQGRVGNASGLRSPNGTCWIGLIRLQVSQLSTYLLMYFRWSSGKNKFLTEVSEASEATEAPQNFDVS